MTTPDKRHSVPCKKSCVIGGLYGMDTFRRRSHRTHHEHRADELADLLGRVLRQYHQAVATDTLEHPCSACATDVAIFTRKAEALGVKVNAR